MADLVVLCTDGSEASIEALQAGLGVIGDAMEPIIVTASEPPDPMLVTGSGHAGPLVDSVEYDALAAASQERAADVLSTTTAALNLSTARSEVLDGSAGPAICTFADDIGARAIVIGTRGRGGIKRALLGSVSDHVVRNASCPVVVVRPGSD